MRVMTIMGSPRRGGNTAKALHWVEDELARAGHTVDRADIIDYRVAGCDDCRRCKEPGAQLCAVDDGANSLFRRMLAADTIVFATPLYCWSFPAQLKALVDRMHCMVEGFTGAPNHKSRLAGKAIAMLMTAGGAYDKNIDLLVWGFENLQAFQQSRPVAPLILQFCTEPEKMGAAEEKRAREFAAALCPAPEPPAR
jgi:multimeric flavodoxin WrbA